LAVVGALEQVLLVQLATDQILFSVQSQQLAAVVGLIHQMALQQPETALMEALVAVVRLMGRLARISGLGELEFLGKGLQVAHPEE
jgi:hypothetical protein